MQAIHPFRQTARRRWRHTIALVPASVLLLVLLYAVSPQAAQAQANPHAPEAPQAEKVVDNVKIIADLFEEIGGPNSGFFIARGNVRIALKNGDPLIKVENTGPIDDPFPDEDPDHAIVACTPDQCIVAGKISWITDPDGALIETGFNDNGIREGVELLTKDGKLVRPTKPVEGVEIRNSSQNLRFLDRLQMRDFFKSDDPNEFKDINFTFDLNTKKFTGEVPLTLRLLDDGENPDLKLTSVVIVDDKGKVTGSINGFKARFAGLLVSISSITVKVGEFEAAKAEILKADNPDLPNLDPTNPQVVFSFEKLRYKDGRFSIGGGTTPINNWTFGDAFRMTSQSIGLTNDVQTQTAFFTIHSTLEFGAVAEDPSKLPITIRISFKEVDGVGRPILEAGLQNMSPKLGIFKVNLQGVRLVGDPVDNFFGVKADTAALQWPQHLGGKTAAGVGNFRLGINRDKQLQFNLANGAVTSPELESAVFRGTLGGAVSVVEETVTFVLSGNLSVRLAGNANVGAGANLTMRAGKNVCADTSSSGLTLSPLISKPNAPPPSCLKRYEKSLSAFNLKVAGFGLGIQNPRGLADGGFAADVVSLTLPQGVNGLNGTINGFVMHGDGRVQIAGGGFELSPIAIGGVQFVGLKGSFVRKDDGGYEFVAGGKMPLPGVEPGANGPGISATVIVRANAFGSFGGMGVEVVFTAAPGTGLPIGSTGMELTRIGGSFNLNEGTVTIGVSMRASTLARIPAPLNLPLASIDGSASLQINPFLFTSNARLSVLIFEVASASVKVGHQQGFSGGNGMHVQFQVQGVIVHGNAQLRVGRVTVNGEPKNRFAASASFFVGLEKGQFGAMLPPVKINVAGVAFSGGRFIDKRNSPERETAGLLGTVCVTIFCGSLFADLGASGPRVDLVNQNKFELIDSAAVRVAAAQGRAGFASRAMSVEEAHAAGLVLAANQISGVEKIMQETIPVVITQTTTLVVGIEYASGDPLLRLQLPDNSELTEQNVNNTTQVFLRDNEPNSSASQVFILGHAAPGVYTLFIDNAPADYQKVSYTLNNPPVVTITGATCGSAPVAGITVSCDGAPAGSQVTLNWEASDIDNEDTQISIGYAPVPTDTSPIDFTAVDLLVEGQPLGAGQLTWDLSETPTGRYKLAVIAEDGSNAPVVVYSELTVDVLDQRPPAVPAGLQGIPQAGELSVRWEQNGERDLAGYEIGFGVVDDGNPDTPDHFVYTRNMGPKDVITGTSNIVDGKLWGLDDDTEIYYSLRAYDLSGNFSDWAPMQTARPWPLSPQGWTPTPASEEVEAATVIDVSFATPLDPASLDGALTVTASDGAVITGEIEHIVNLDGAAVLGMRLTPAQRLQGETTYTVTVKGGATGVTAADGRQMPADYRWSFTVGVSEATPDDFP
ncbi:MAG: Ig-like domain-containing protein, partial [Caldilineaceae bacterium]|nr:Ig-like domain-containing protein [Caldilineaceae bacterium]